MQLQPIGSMPFCGQDGAFWGDFMFRFDARGNCQVYDAAALDGAATEAPVRIERISMPLFSDANIMTGTTNSRFCMPMFTTTTQRKPTAARGCAACTACSAPGWRFPLRWCR